MLVPVTIPTPLRGYAGGQKTVSVEGATVGEALSALTTQYPNLRLHLFAENGQLRSFVNVYLNDEDVRFGRGVETPLRETDKISIVPSVAGGSARNPSLRVTCQGESLDNVRLPVNRHGNTAPHVLRAAAVSRRSREASC